MPRPAFRRCANARRTASFAFAMALALASAGVAPAALPPQYPGGGDECRVVAGAAPSIDYKAGPAGQAVAPGPGAGRIYTVPALLDCRGDTATARSHACDPAFLVWAKTACRGLDIRQ